MSLPICKNQIIVIRGGILAIERIFNNMIESVVAGKASAEAAVRQAASECKK